MTRVMLWALVAGCGGRDGGDSGAGHGSDLTGTGTGGTGTGTGAPATGTGGGPGTGSAASGTGTGPTGTGTGALTDTGPITDTGWTGGTFAPPTRLEVDCAPEANPLRFTCTVTVEPPQPVQVQFGRQDGLGAKRIHTSARAVRVHEVPLYFMAADRLYDVRATAVAWPSAPTADAVVRAGLVPVERQTWLTAIAGASRAPMIGTHFPCRSNAVVVIYDTATGDLLWYEDLDPNGRLGLLDMVRFTDEHTVLGEADHSVTEVDLVGVPRYQLVRGIDFVDYLHHDVLRRGDLIYAPYQLNVGGLVLHGVLVMDTTGQEVARWDPRDHLDVPPGVTDDWFHMNTVFLDAQGDMYVSFLSQNTVAKVVGDPAAPNFGEAIWVLGMAPAGMGNDFAVDWSLVDGVDTFARQHNVRVRPDGALTLLDNEGGRGLAFTLDEGLLTATAVESYPTVEGRCGAQGTMVETTGGSQMVACRHEILEYEGGAADVIWEAEAACAEVEHGIVTGRWYPLEGW